MTLDEFKRIFYMEYAHRMWGRTTGMAFLLPAAFFWAKGWFSKPLKARAGVYAVLIGFQVSSNQNPRGHCHLLTRNCDREFWAGGW